MDVLLGILYMLLGTASVAAFVVWLTFKIKVASAARRINHREIYKNTIKSVRQLRPSKIMLVIFWVLFGIVGLALVYGILTSIFALFAMIFTLGGAMYVDTGADSSGFYNFLNSVGMYWKIFVYWGYSIFIVLILFFARNTYINIVCRNRLLKMEPYTVNEIPPSEVLKSTPEQRKKRIIIICSIIAAAIVYYVIYYVFDFDIVGDLLLEFM